MIASEVRAIARDEAERITRAFVEAGAQPVEAAILQPAETLLDLYGEDIRARAYVTADPLRGEMMLRPDFTVPVVQMHMESGADPARYTYSGEVFRRQETDAERPWEFLQVGFEIMGGTRPHAADAEVFATLHAAVDGLKLRAAMGDIGLLMAAVKGLKTTAARKTALLRHIWRPRRFRSLMERYAGRTEVPASRKALLAAADPFEGTGPEIGLRTRADVGARIAALREDAQSPPISGEEVALIEALTAVREDAPYALSALRDLAVDLPAIRPAVGRLSERLDAMAGRGIEVETLEFEASFGRTTLEYYDGFVFGLYAPARPDLPPVVTGGRYDALTRVLGRGREVPAVGGVIRPELALRLRGTT